jgi:hypothetical protein
VYARQAIGCGKRFPPAQQNIPKKSPPFSGELEQSAMIAGASQLEVSSSLVQIESR